MKIGSHRIKTFKQVFVISFFGLTLVGVIPLTLNYFFQAVEPVPNRENLLSMLWVLPLVSVLCAVIAALLAKDDQKEK